MPQVADIPTLRKTFKAFQSESVFSDEAIQFWLDVANELVSPARWGNNAAAGAMLLTCHHLTLAQRAAASGASGGGGGGGGVGVLNSKSIDGVSLGYDVSRSTLEGAGHYNLTSYGLQYLQLCNIYGIGPVHVGEDTIRNHSSAWPGFIYPSW